MHASRLADPYLEIERLQTQLEAVKMQLEAALQPPARMSAAGLSSPLLDGMYAVLYRAWERDPAGFVPKDRLMFAVYGWEQPGAPSTLHVHMCKLQQRLPPGQRITNVWGRGYRLTVESTNEPKRSRAR